MAILCDLRLKSRESCSVGRAIRRHLCREQQKSGLVPGHPEARGGGECPTLDALGVDEALAIMTANTNALST